MVILQLVHLLMNLKDTILMENINNFSDNLKVILRAIMLNMIFSQKNLKKKYV